MSSPPPPPPAPSVYSSYLLIIVATAILLIIAITLVINSCRCILMESLLPSFTSRRSKKESKYAEMIPVCRYQEEQSFSTECSVCLIAFQEGEKVKQLPACRHSFHGPCVDMWLYSHSSCPLCRAGVPLAAKVENDKQQRVELREAALVIASAV